MSRRWIVAHTFGWPREDQGMPRPPQSVRFHELGDIDLVVDAILVGGTAGTSADDPIGKLLPVGNSGGFRYRGPRHAPLVVALCSSGRDVNWPDRLDPETGIYTYYGDNRRPGSPLLETPRGGNRILTEVFHSLHTGADQRSRIPPFFLFESTGDGRDNRFLGLAVPGAAEVDASDDLVAMWRSTNGRRFQNYRAVFTVLDVEVVPRAWIKDILAGDALSASCPGAFRDWVDYGRYAALRAPRTVTFRTKEEQLPANLAVLQEIHTRFADRPHEFEACAALIWRMMHGSRVQDVQLTPPSVDGGRDAIGYIAVGPEADPIRMDFALEAKCFAPGRTAVGVGDMKRLISRLRHRQFGVLVTTSYVAAQAYREIREDGHPIVIISGADIIGTLRDHGVTSVNEVRQWLCQDFRAAVD